MPVKSLVPEILGAAVLRPGDPGAPGGPGGAAAPSAGAGFELGVYDAASNYSTLLTMVPQRLWTSFTFSKLLNDKGSGTITLNMDDPFWSTPLAGGLAAHYLLDEEHVWAVFQEGVRRFDFLGETITEQLVDASEQRVVTITGPGTINVLTWAMAAPPGFPGAIVYKTDSLTDDFSAVNSQGQYIIDYGLWNASSNTADISVNPSGSAQLIGTAAGTVLGTTEWDFTNTLFSAQVTPITSPDWNNVTLDGSQVTQLYIESLDGHGYYVMIGMSSTSLYAQYHGPDGTFTQVIATAAQYGDNTSSSYEYQYWQLSESNGTFYFWTSEDGQTWDKAFQVARNWDSSRVGVYFATKYGGSTSEYATITSINSDVVTSSLGGATYLSEPIVSVYLQTLQAAKDRGTIPYVTSSATAVHDSFGNPWIDSQSVQIQNGTDLFSLLQGHASMVDADYIMEPGFRLVVGLPAANTPNEGQVTLGYDRSSTVRFFEGERITMKQRQRARDQIANLVAAINSDSITVTAEDASSAATWGQREAWVQAAAQVTSQDLSVVASASAQQSADEILSWTLQILPWQAGKTVFRDFAVGDWVGQERPDFSAVDAVRVTGITVSVDQDGDETHELVLESYVQWLEQRLTYIATKMGGGFVSANGTTAISNNAQGSTLQSPTVFSQSLSSLGIPTTSGGAPLVYNPVTGQWVPAGSTDPTTGSEVPLTVGGAGGSGQTTVSAAGLQVAASSSSTQALNANPSFAGGSLANWQGLNATIAAIAPAAGLPPSVTNAARITPSGSSVALIQTGTTLAPVQAGQSYTLFADVYLPTQANMGITTEISWYTASGTLIRTDGLSTVIPAGQWVQLGYQDNAPAGATQAAVAVGVTSGSSSNPAQVANVALVAGASSTGTSASSTTITPTGTTVVDSTGTVRIVTGLQADGTVTTNYYNAPAPNAPDAPSAAGIMLGLSVTWDGLLNGAAPLSDFDHVEVHVSSTGGFTPSTATLYTTMRGPGTVSIGQLAGGTIYYVKLVAVNEAGISSAPSAQASATAATVSANIPPGAISEIQLAAGVGGVMVTIGPTAPSSPHTDDLWYSGTAATGYTLEQYNGTTWQAYQFGTSAIAAGAITAAQIAAQTITAAQIASGTLTSTQIQANSLTSASIAANTILASNLAAGIVVGGIVDGTIVTGATIVADGTTGQFLIYSGVPGNGNLIGSWSGVPGTDSYGNSYPAGLSVQQGAITGIDVDSVTITNSTIQGDVLDGSTISGATITGGTMVETSIVFDQTGGELLVYTSTVTTVTQNVAGDYQITFPSTTTTASVYVWGAGAGGDGGMTSTGGNGGAGGQVSGNASYGVTPGGTYNYTVGAGGNGGSTGNGHGQDGGDSFFDGQNGIYAQGGAGNGTASTVQQGSGSFWHTGGNGGTGSTSGGAGAGGNSANTNSVGDNGANATSSTGAGSPFVQAGSGNGGAGGNSGGNGSNGTSPGAGGGGAGKGTSSSGSLTKSYSPTWAGSYYGPDASSPNALRSTSTMYQGGESSGGGSTNGNQRALWRFNSSQIQSDFSGYTITGCTFTITNQHSWYNSGMTVEFDCGSSLIGSSRPGSWPSGINKLATGGISEGATHTFGMGATVGGYFASNRTDVMGIGANVASQEPWNLNYYGYFASSATLTITGTKSVSGTCYGGSGADGQVVISYATGQTLVAAISPEGGTDQYGNSYVTGGSFQNIQLYGASTPGTPPANSTILYSDSNGSPTFKTSSGYTAQVTGSQGNIQSFTSTSGSTLTAAFPVGANDANVGTAYRLKAWGFGTYSSGSTNWFGITGFGQTGTAQIRLASLPTSGFLWTAEALVEIVTIGSTGTANFVLTVEIATNTLGNATAASKYIGINTAPESNTTVSAISVNTTVATTFEIEFACNGTASVTGIGSTFERLGA